MALKKYCSSGDYQSVFYGHLIYKLKEVADEPIFCEQMKYIINQYKLIRYNEDISLQTARLMVNKPHFTTLLPSLNAHKWVG